MSRQRVIIDCDPGIDDTVAILLALAAPEAIDVAAITCVAGNQPLGAATANACRILDLVDCRELSVFPGCVHPLMTAHEPGTTYHGRDGLGDAGLPPPSSRPARTHAVDFLVETVMGEPADSISLCALGPLTNVALAFVREPRLPARLKELLIMGGAVSGPGNATPHAEFNFFVDPAAAHIVCASAARLVLFDLQVTRQAAAHAHEPGRLRDALAESPSGVAKTVAAMLSAPQLREPCLYDACVVAHLADDSLFCGKSGRVAVEWRAESEAGRTTFHAEDARHANALVMTEVDDRRFLDLLRTRLTSYP